ncbi:MAG: radical SAM protein, partial [Ignavibacteria bacterium]|nr:radical SAM protein [Ignavibacteria bacterium]
YLTYRCNADCYFCHFGFSTELNRSPFADVNEVFSNLEEIRKLGVKYIDFTGGEPLLHSKIPQILTRAKELKFQTSITTNCLLYPRYAEKIAGKVDLLHFSLDSPDEEEHNRIRKSDCFKSVIESIRIAKSLGEFPDILFTATNQNYEKIPAMYDLALKHQLVLIINPVFSYFGNEGLSIKALDFIEEFISGKRDLYINPSFIKLRRDGGNDIQNPKCKAVSRVIVITPENEIILPCYHLGIKKIKIDRTLREIWQSDEVRYYEQMQGRFDFCNGCTINCYFEPSFALPTNLYSILSIKSKINYGYSKLIKQKFYKLKHRFLFKNGFTT